MDNFFAVDNPLKVVLFSKKGERLANVLKGNVDGNGCVGKQGVLKTVQAAVLVFDKQLSHAEQIAPDRFALFKQRFDFARQLFLRGGENVARNVPNVHNFVQGQRVGVVQKPCA